MELEYTFEVVMDDHFDICVWGEDALGITIWHSGIDVLFLDLLQLGCGGLLFKVDQSDILVIFED